MQVNPTAEPDTIQRVYRLLAQRFHPDNKETGHDARFREIHEAYETLSDPAKRAKYGAGMPLREMESLTGRPRSLTPLMGNFHTIGKFFPSGPDGWGQPLVICQ